MKKQQAFIISKETGLRKEKVLPFSRSLLRTLAQTYKTPLYVYDERGIRQNAQKLKAAFGWSPGYRNYFAVKATPTPAILRLLAGEGMGFDCSSLTEMKMVEAEGLLGGGVFYTSNNTADADYRYADSIGAVINLDKAVYLEQVVKALGRVPETMAIRYNPGSSIKGNHIIGHPQEAKFGDTAEHLLQAVGSMKRLGVGRIGLHMMAVSNERRPEVFGRAAGLIKELIDRIREQHDLKIAFVNLGGGFGIDYHPSEEPTDIGAIGRAIQAALGDSEAEICTEAGRYLTGPHGYLLTSVTRGIVEAHRTFLTVDTSVNNLNRLVSIEGAYHHLSLVGRSGPTRKMTVVGSMCTDGDRLFKDRLLPATARLGDLLVIHDVGAHGRADATNYNGLPRCAEVLVRSDGTHQLIRRHENVDDLLATSRGL